MQGRQPTKSNLKESHFRSELLSSCKKQFDKLLETPVTVEAKDEKETEEERKER